MTWLNLFRRRPTQEEMFENIEHYTRSGFWWRLWRFLTDWARR